MMRLIGSMLPWWWIAYFSSFSHWLVSLPPSFSSLISQQCGITQNPLANSTLGPNQMSTSMMNNNKNNSNNNFNFNSNNNDNNKVNHEKFSTRLKCLLSTVFCALWMRTTYMKQVTRGHNIVANGWAGASNPHPYTMPPTHTQEPSKTFIFTLFYSCPRTERRTNGPTDKVSHRVACPQLKIKINSNNAWTYQYLGFFIYFFVCVFL